MISAPFQGKLFNITVIQVNVLTSNAEEAGIEMFYEDLQYPLELTRQKDVLFIIGNWMQMYEAKKYLEKQTNVTLEYKMKQGKS